MIKNEFPEWIYSPVNDPMWNNLFERIEDALGFKLFIWQKTYIMGLGYRCSGQTTADVLRNLVGERTSESIYLERPKNRREDFYQKELIEIKRKLDDKGIISRDIERKKTMTIERLLKELGERHFEVLWRYEVLTNSIVIQMDKRYCHQWYRLARKVTLDDFHHFITDQFEDTMVRFLKEMAQELEYQIKVAPEPMKGEDND